MIRVSATIAATEVTALTPSATRIDARPRVRRRGIDTARNATDGGMA
ncbi:MULTISPECIES: hypothetical protein [Natrinema]|nr:MULTISPECIES: hypothetical protein [Natrinema]